MKEKHSLADLLRLMERLRDPSGGCPWDRKQQFESIVPHTIEEAYEVAEAIHRKDMDHVEDELGDLLFQVVFYSQLGKEAGHFDFHSVVNRVVEKLLRRHPHVFPQGTLESRLPEGTVISEKEIKASWERIKKQEREEKARQRAANGDPEPGFESRLKAVSDTLPPLAVAEKLQNKAAQVGFDWKTIKPVFDKLDEELEELKEVALESDGRLKAVVNHKEIEHELGDVLFCCVNLGRFLDVKPENALRQANKRFRQRFGYIEERLNSEGRGPENASLEEMEALWQEAKNNPPAS